MDAEREIVELQTKIVELLENIEREKNRPSSGGLMGSAKSSIPEMEKQLKSYAEALKAVQKTAKEEEAETKKRIKAIKAFTSDLSKYSTDILKGSSGVSSSLSTLQPVIKQTSMVLGALTGPVGSAIQAIGSMSAFVSKFGGAGKLAGAAITGLGSVIEKVGPEVADKLGDVASWYLTTLDTQIQTYSVLAKSGALSADGFDHLAKRANQAGISFSDLASVISQQSSGLSFVYGTVSSGIDNVARASEQLKDSGDMLNLRKLGYSPDEIVDLMAQFANIQTMLGNRRELDERKLRAGTLEYVKNLDILSRLTGKRSEAIAAKMGDYTSENRFGQYLETVAPAYQGEVLAYVTWASEKFGEEIGRAHV